MYALNPLQNTLPNYHLIHVIVEVVKNVYPTSNQLHKVLPIFVEAFGQFQARMFLWIPVGSCKLFAAFFL
jgi:hypothetical protein